MLHNVIKHNVIIVILYVGLMLTAGSIFQSSIKIVQNLILLEVNVSIS